MAIKKIVDKWKLKKWYTVLAPPMFDNKEICEVVAAEDQLLTNRIVRISLMELMSTSSQTSMFTFLRFRISGVAGNTAQTTLIGHEVSPSYIKTFARRGKTILHMIVDIKTKDDVGVRIKVVGVATGKISETTKRNLRNTIVEEIKKAGPTFKYDELMQEILYGRLVSKIFNHLKQITSMKRFEIRKTEKQEQFT
ncbi:hypothetical protein J4450_05550 [Candidatus Micrarchaeota archaeon]|nr:hypothetical protein [Candidatus Micrarchaeota archaeon]